MITSLTNPKLKTIKKAHQDRRFREKEGVFVAEGIRWLRAIQEADLTPTLLLSTETAYQTHQSEFGSLVPELTSDQAMASISDVDSPPGIIMLCEKPLAQIPTPSTLLLILDRIQTPGNLGTILRTASATGTDAVILTPGSVDPYNSKVVRGSMSAHLTLPIISADWPEIEQLTSGFQIAVTDLTDKSQNYVETDWQKPSAIIIGNEANGVSDYAKKVGQSIHIPMQAGTESLNAAVSASVVLYEVARQREFCFGR